MPGPPAPGSHAPWLSRPGTKASSSSAASAAERASGPATTSCAGSPELSPAGTSPRPGFNPPSPHAAAGLRTEPPPSDPGAQGSSPAATAAALPPEEPPELRLSAYGLRDGGAIRFSL